MPYRSYICEHAPCELARLIFYRRAVVGSIQDSRAFIGLALVCCKILTFVSVKLITLDCKLCF